MTDKTSDLDTMLATENEPLMVGGKEVMPRTIKVGQIGKVLNAVRPFNSYIQLAAKGGNPAEGFDVMTVLEHHSDNLVRLVSLLTGEEESFINELELDDMIKITTKVMEVNLDFFIRKVFPLLSVEMAKLGGAMSKIKPVAGQTASSNSSGQGTVILQS